MKSKKDYFVLAIIIAILSFMAYTAFAQEIHREGNNFSVEKVLQASTDIQTQYTFTINETVYPIWITKNGRCYIVRISKSGKEYKQYMKKEISLQICKEMNIEYKE